MGFVALVADKLAMLSLSDLLVALGGGAGVVPGVSVVLNVDDGRLDRDDVWPIWLAPKILIADTGNGSALLQGFHPPASSHSS